MEKAGDWGGVLGEKAPWTQADCPPLGRIPDDLPLLFGSHSGFPRARASPNFHSPHAASQQFYLFHSLFLAYIDLLGSFRGHSPSLILFPIQGYQPTPSNPGFQIYLLVGPFPRCNTSFHITSVTQNAGVTHSCLGPSFTFAPLPHNC